MENNFVENQAVTSIDVKKYIFKILSYWYLFIIAFACAWIYIYIQNKYILQQYQVHATILVKDRVGPENVVGGLRLAPQRGMEDEITILTSYFLTKKVLNELDFNISYFKVGNYVNDELYKKAPFTVIADTSQMSFNGQSLQIRILDKNEFEIQKYNKSETSENHVFGELFSIDNMTCKIMLNDNFNERYINKDFLVVFNSENSLIRTYSNKLIIRRVNQSNSILSLSIVDRVPEKGADYINTLIKVYQRHDLKEKNEIAQSIIDFIDSQLVAIVDSLTEAQDNLQTFRLNNQIIDVDDKGNTLFNQLDELLNKKSVLKFQRKYYLDLLENIKDDEELRSLMPPSIIGINAPMLTGYLNELEELVADREMLKYSIKKDIPKIDVINFKIKKAKEALQNYLYQILEANRMSLDEINDEISKLTIEIQKLPHNERQILNLTRNFQLNDNLYTHLLQKRSDAEITKASNKSDIRFIDYALADNATIRSTNQANETTAFIIAFLIPIAFVLLKDYFNTKITDRSDIEGKVRIPILGSIGHNPRDTEIAVLENPNTPLAETFRTLRTNLQYFLVEKQSRIISLTSTISGEGKTFCAINLAAAIAILNKKVILVGLDMRKPKIHKTFKIDNQTGLSTYLIGQNSADEIIKKTRNENLCIVTSGPVPPNPAELIETDRMSGFIDKIKKEYDFVIIDTPPIALVTDALLISKFSDANIFVVRQEYSNKNIVSILNELENNKQINNLSILINDVKIGRGYGNRYAYKYGYKFGYGYGYYQDDSNKSFWKKIKRRIS